MPNADEYVLVHVRYADALLLSHYVVLRYWPWHCYVYRILILIMV